MTILQVYEQYKHVDYLIGDPTWLPENFLGKIIQDLWTAIKLRAEIEIAAQRVPITLQPPEDTRIYPHDRTEITEIHPKATLCFSVQKDPK